MRAGLIGLLLAALPVEAGPPDDAWRGHLDSPDGRLRAEIVLNEEGRLWFVLSRDGEPVIQPSPLGITLAHTSFVEGLAVSEPSPSEPSPVEPVSDVYRLWGGKQTDVVYRAHELAVTLRKSDGKTADDLGLVIRLRLSNDGLAYRYELLGESQDTRIVTSEESGVHFLPGTKAWLQPKAEARSGWSSTNPSYEEEYLQEIDVGTPSPSSNGWVYPALFRVNDTWFVLSEAGMDGNYCGSGLAQESPDGLYRLQFPQDKEVVTNGKRLPEAQLPFHSPWRLILAGSLKTIVESTLGTDLADPSVLTRTDFIQPGISAWSWALLKDDATVYPVQKDFVDYASQMGWPYVLVDADWDQKIGHETLAELARYAAERDVELLVWYNSSGDWNETIYTPKSRLLTRADRRAEFGRLRLMGIRGIKVDFFPGDGMSVVRYARDILSDAADFELLVNFHGAVLPRGLQRTFPNLMTVEAVKGLEFITFTQEFADRAAPHAAMLPFTRNLFDPMDFTPMVLGDIPSIERRTSNGFELALPILYTSGIQHLVTTPEQMKSVPEFVQEFLRELPVQWEETRFVTGEPGKYVVLARRAGDRWFVAGINAEGGPKRLELDLSFVPSDMGRLLSDGEGPRDVQVSKIQPGPQELTLEAASGFVMVFDN